MQHAACQLTFLRKSLDKIPFVCYIITMKAIKDLNSEFNKMFNDEVFMPMIKFAVTLLFIVVVLDFGFQLIEAVDVLVTQ